MNEPPVEWLKEAMCPLLGIQIEVNDVCHYIGRKGKVWSCPGSPKGGACGKSHFRLSYRGIEATIHEQLVDGTR
jgi:hypothetical protein